MKTQCPRAIIPSLERGLTTLLIKDLRNCKKTPKLIKWDEVTLPNHWKIEQAVPPKTIENKEIDSIIEHNEGSVEINFIRNNSFNSFIQSRASVSNSHEQKDLLSRIKLDQVSKIGEVYHPLYSRNSDESFEPSLRDFEINVIDLVYEFVIKNYLLRKDFNSFKKIYLKTWFLDLYDSQQKAKFRELLYKKCKIQKRIFYSLIGLRKIIL